MIDSQILSTTHICTVWEISFFQVLWYTLLITSTRNSMNGNQQRRLTQVGTALNLKGECMLLTNPNQQITYTPTFTNQIFGRAYYLQKKFQPWSKLLYRCWFQPNTQTSWWCLRECGIRWNASPPECSASSCCILEHRRLCNENIVDEYNVI